jgi:hypothetical protein
MSCQPFPAQGCVSVQDFSIFRTVEWIGLSFPVIVIDSTLREPASHVTHRASTQPARDNEFRLLAFQLQQHYRAEHLRITMEATHRDSIACISLLQT